MAANFLKSVSFALKGLKHVWQERNFKIHIIIATVTIIFGFVFKIQSLEWTIVLICIAAVLSLEMVNTAIEHLVNLIEPNYNPKAGIIKDLAAGAVLVFSIISVIIGIMIFGKYALDLL